MKVEATWRGEGRLEVLISGIQPAEADALLDTLKASAQNPQGFHPKPSGQQR